MQIKLRGSEGYYAREVKLGGHSFRIRELEDDEYAQAIELMQAALRVADSGLGATGEVTAGRAGAAQALEVSGEEAARVLRTSRGAVDYVVARGLVGWDLPGAECTPETAVLLPSWVKLELCQTILRETQLQPEEQGNS